MNIIYILLSDSFSITLSFVGRQKFEIFTKVRKICLNKYDNFSLFPLGTDTGMLVAVGRGQ
uniref:Uncharacterized protein n=1 Tax=Meloidogyne enterolobii TaxID=390850 RepID=A0A6V7V064_MELEN|nr:unnamed protein product [Meloidogyne enterolobii]